MPLDPDPDPQTWLNPDPIRIRIRIHNTGSECDTWLILSNILAYCKTKSFINLQAWVLKMNDLFKLGFLLFKCALNQCSGSTCGSVWKWLPWIRISIGNWDSGSRSRTVKMKSKKEKRRDLKLKRELTIFLMAFTWAWKSSVKGS